MIVAHLDLDAFFAAVEELEDPRCARCRSSSAATRTAAASSRPRTTSPAASGSTRRCRAPRRCAAARTRSSSARATRSTRTTRARSGRRSARSCRRSSRRGSTRATSTSRRSRRRSTTRARSPRRCAPSCARARASRARSGVATSKVVAKVASDRRKPGGLTVVRPGREARVPRAVPDPPAAGRRAARRGAARRRRHRDDRPAGRPDRRASCGVHLRGVVGRSAARPRARHRPPPARGLDRADLDLERGDVRAATSPTRERLHDELRRQADELAAHLREPRPGRAHGDDEAALPRLRDPDPVDLAGRRHRRRRRASASSRARCSTGRCATGPARCASSGSVSRASPTTCNFRCPRPSE